MFWKHNWVGDSCLREIFPKLYTLSVQKNGYICQMGEWHGGVRRWVFKWRRKLSCREIAQKDLLLQTLQNVQLSQGIKDSSRWSMETPRQYTVKSTYGLLLEPLVGEFLEVFQVIWSKVLPSKVCALACRVLLDRIPTKVNMFRRKVFTYETLLSCVFSNSERERETTEHLFFLCSRVSIIWTRVYKQMGFVTVLPRCSHSHLLQQELVCLSAKQNKLWRALWSIVIWTVWNCRNKFIFKNIEVEEEREQQN